MQDIYQRASKLKGKLTDIRRRLHQNAEAGFSLTETSKIIEEELKGLSLSPKRVGRGSISALIADPANGSEAYGTILLRADMDALPIQEKTDLPFASSGGCMHACGHDMHAAMLLGASYLLTSYDSLPCRVKLLFQAAEETLEGAADAIEAGILESPTVDAAVMIHVLTGVDFPSGMSVVSSEGISAPAAGYFTVEVTGKATHGAASASGVDAIYTAARILEGLNGIISREVSPMVCPALCIGRITGGNAANQIADSCSLFGTFRALTMTDFEFMRERIRSISRLTAHALRAKAKVTFGPWCPPLANDGYLSDLAYRTLSCVFGKENVFSSEMLSKGTVGRSVGGSEDFSHLSQKVPSVMVAIGAGDQKEGFSYPLHHPMARFDEEALPIGAAALAAIALGYGREKGARPK